MNVCVRERQRQRKMKLSQRLKFCTLACSPRENSKWKFVIKAPDQRDSHNWLMYEQWPISSGQASA